MINHDAAWVFVKYSTDSGVTWYHATLKTSNAATGYDLNPTSLGYSRGSGTTLDILVSDDNTTTAGGGYGAFLRRSNSGSGTVTTTDIQFVWDWGQDGLSASTSAQVRVYAIEMTYIPTGSFYIGDGNGSSESTVAFHENGVDNTAVQITTASKNITCDSNVNDDIDTTPVAVDGDGGITGNASWPVGYSDFYLMKYELSQAQYRDFLNTLSRDQQHTRTASNLTSADEDDANTYVMIAEGQATPLYRQTVKAGSNPGSGSSYTFTCDLDDDDTGNESNDGEWIAMNYIAWMDLCAYADWAGLRPFTETEFEKAARGSANIAVYGEYAWGSTTYREVIDITNSGQASEGASDDANFNVCISYCAFLGPLRTGFAAGSATDREQAAAGYYGNMELSGNLWEVAVTLGNTSGRAFQGTHGDGVLTTAATYEGNATNSDWPGINASTDRGVTGASGSGNHGAGFDDSAYVVSFRGVASSGSSSRYEAFGGRLARTAPE